jgi:putative ABC transport system permease protein
MPPTDSWGAPEAAESTFLHGWISALKLAREAHNRINMIRNYFTIALRGILRNRSYTFINVTGLALGITTCLIIFLIIKRELSFDSTFSKADLTYRIVRDFKDASGGEKTTITPYPLWQAMKNDFPDITSTQFHYHSEALMTIGTDKSRVQNILFADTSFFEVFDMEVLSGNPKKELAEPGKVFLTEEFAKKLGDKNIKHLKLDNLIDLEVAGIIRTPATPSHIAINMVASRATLTPDVATKFLGFTMDQWGLSSSGYTYVVLPPQVTRESVEQRFPALIKKYFQPDEAVRNVYSLQPLASIHFDTEYSENPGTSSTPIRMLIVLGFIGIFILIIACVNFINLSTALSVQKSKEVGVRKTLGAQQSQLALQYLSEAFLLTGIAAVVSVGIAEWVAPIIGSFLERDIQMNLMHNPQLFVFLVLIVFFTALLSGSYPALVLSRFNPVKALRNKISYQNNSPVPVRKLLVVVQFFIAQVLIICTLVVSSQISFFRTKSLGFSKDAVINVNLPDNKIEILEALRNRLQTNEAIKDVSFSLGAPIARNNFGTGMFLTEKGEEERYGVAVKPVDIHYKDVYGLDLIEGRWFLESDEKLASLKEKSQWVYVVNETAVRTLGFSSPKDIIGKSLTIGFNSTAAPVIGVVRDFHTASLQSKLGPVVLLPFNMYYDAGIKISTDNIPATIKHVEEAWSQQFPEYLFEYTFLDVFLGRMYKEEERMFRLFEIFAGIAIFIGCLGLYGLASFMANQKTKEVAIRKTLGASISQIVVLFSKEFVLLVVLAFVFAAPVAWYAMNKWLEGFAYKVELQWIVFVGAVLFTMVITLITVGYRSLRAAVANPVDALKTE